MWIYLTVIIILFLLFINEITAKSEKRVNRLFLVGAAIVFFILAFRGEYVGGDTDDYCGFFNGAGGMYGTIDNPHDEIDLGFIWFTYSLRTLFGDSSFVLLFFTSLFTLLPILYIINRDSNSKILPLLMYMLTFNVLSLSQTSIRQNLSISFILIAYIVFSSGSKKQYSKKHKYLRYTFLACCCVWAYLCHHTTLISVPLFILCMNFHFNKKTAIITLVSTLILSVIVQNSFKEYFDLVILALSSFGDTEMMTRHAFMSTGDLYSYNFNLILPPVVLVCLIIYLMEEEEIKSMLTTCLVVGTCLYTFGRSFELISRVTLILTYLGIAAVPSTEGFRKHKNITTLLFVILIWFTYKFCDYCQNSPSAIFSDQIVPYNFIFE